ncbi:MAG: aminotransferase class IV [Alphaproteobacteria bacterium]|nr:aminotransferase class IV [Alphaproteobacteria bacterium]
MIPLNDRGLLLGDGLFETMLAVDGTVAMIDAHLARMAAGCVALGLPALDRDAARAQGLAAAPAAGRAAVRLTLTAGSGGRGLERPVTVFPRLIAVAAPSPVVDTPAALVIVAVRRNEGSPAARFKTLAYLDNVLARAEARAAGADEAVMLNNRGQLACAAAANLFWIEGDRLITPALDCGVLAGITRGRVLTLARDLGIEVLEVAAGRERLEAADGVFLTNSLIGVRPVSRLGERTLAAHALTERLGAGFR